MSENNSRLDRIEAAINNQFALNAELRTSVEILNNAVETQRRETTELRSAVESLLQIAQIHQRDIELLTSEFRRDRSDGHGA